MATSRRRHSGRISLSLWLNSADHSDSRLGKVEKLFQTPIPGRMKTNKESAKGMGMSSRSAFSSDLENNSYLRVPRRGENIYSRFKTRCPCRDYQFDFYPLLSSAANLSISMSARETFILRPEMNDLVSPTRSRAICQITLVCPKHFPNSWKRISSLGTNAPSARPSVCPRARSLVSRH